MLLLEFQRFHVTLQVKLWYIFTSFDITDFLDRQCIPLNLVVSWPWIAYGSVWICIKLYYVSTYVDITYDRFTDTMLYDVCLCIWTMNVNYTHTSHICIYACIKCLCICMALLLCCSHKKCVLFLGCHWAWVAPTSEAISDRGSCGKWGAVFFGRYRYVVMWSRCLFY